MSITSSVLSFVGCYCGTSFDKLSRGKRRGPFSRVLRDYGVQGEVLGLVVGAFGEVSQDVHHLRDVVAEKLVEIHTSYFKIPTNRAKSFVVNLLTRKWGHSIARGWARLLLERLRENVDLPADLKSFATNPDAIETEDEK